MNGVTNKTHIHRSMPTIVAENTVTIRSPSNIPHESMLPNINLESINLESINLESINLAQAIAKHDHYYMDKIPTLVVRYSKTY
ncbi:unnamed protein product [Rotaria sp. Silwood2]|nr:unnamed protein product [Rotaria sp. Silwood2]CAF4219877.1 unnamed protein product [Rotaria sp. Silwood2]